MQKKRILIFIDWYLPGYKAGGPIQSVANIVAHLREEFDFYIVTSDTDYCETMPYSSIKIDEWNLLPSGENVYYISKNALNRSTIKKLIRKTEADVVYLNSVFSIYFTLYPLYYLRKKKNRKIVIASRGMLAKSALGVKKTKKQIFLLSVKVLKLFDKVVFHASTENERKDIHLALGNTFQVIVAGNLPQKVDIALLPKRTKNEGEVKLINVARIAPEKNLLFAIRILKEVKANVVFDFYGPIYDNSYWEECKKELSELPPNITAEYKGSLEPENVLKELSHCHFMFMPTQGENFGHIILQSFSVGCPVIISNQTPWKELNKKGIGWDLELSSSIKFVRAIEDAAKMNQSEFQAFSLAAFNFSKAYINNAEIVQQNKELFIV